MYELNAQNARTIAEDGELLTAERFSRELVTTNFNVDGPRIRVYGVNMDAESMLEAIAHNDGLELISSSDGLISHVKDNPNAHIADNSGSSRYFSLHTDGQYLPTIPEMAVLYCVDPGTSEVPTVFVDTKDILDVLRDTGRIHETESYEHVFRNKYGQVFIRPLVEINPGTSEPVMNVALASPQCHLRPIEGAGATQQDADNFYDLLQEIAEQQIIPQLHAWRENDAVVFDNRRLIHGRGLVANKNMDISDASRHLLRVWIRRVIDTTPGETIITSR